MSQSEAGRHQHRDGLGHWTDPSWSFTPLPVCPLPLTHPQRRASQLLALCASYTPGILDHCAADIAAYLALVLGSDAGDVVGQQGAATSGHAAPQGGVPLPGAKAYRSSTDFVRSLRGGAVGITSSQARSSPCKSASKAGVRSEASPGLASSTAVGGTLLHSPGGAGPGALVVQAAQRRSVRVRHAGECSPGGVPGGWHTCPCRARVESFDSFSSTRGVKCMT